MHVRQRIEQTAENLTSAERMLVSVLLSDYPFAGLVTIQELAQRAHASSPTVSRFVSKLGFSGYSAFQQALISELKEGQKSPVQLRATQTPFGEAWFGDFMSRAASLMNEVAVTVSEAQFERVTGLLVEHGPAIFFVGGRVSDTLVQYFSRHIRQFRPKVYSLPADPEAWPAYILRMRRGDILFVVDFRRYQQNLERLAGAAVSESGARVVLITDKWISPVAVHATEVLAVPIENGTLWDSYAGALSVMEAMMTRIAESNWDDTSKRIEKWDRVRRELSGPGPETPATDR